MRFWYAHLLVATALTQAAYNAARMLVSYRALGFGGDGMALGILTALFSLVPLVVAVQVGRAVDAGRAAAMLRAGVVLTVGALIVIAVSGELILLGVGNVLLGFGQILVTVAAQGFVPLLSEPGELDRRFAGWSMAVSIGQTAGLPAAGLVSAAGGGEAAVVTTPALVVLAGMSLLALPSALLLPRPRPPGRGDGAAQRAQSVVTMLTIPGMRPAVFASLVVLTSMDVLSAFLPVVGQEHGFGVLLATGLLTLRTGASIVSRGFLPWLLRLTSRRWLLVSATLCSALPMVLIPVAGHPVALGALLLVVGFFWGIGQPLTMTWVVNLVPAGSRASALSLRLTGNRLGQVLVPLGAGAIAGLTGPASVFVVTGALLWTSSGLTWRAVRKGAG